MKTGVVAVLLVLAGGHGAHAAEKWYLMVPPIESVVELSARLAPGDDFTGYVIEHTAFSTWAAEKTFTSVEACEFEIRRRSAVNTRAGVELTSQIEDARKRGDAAAQARMVDLAETLLPYRLRDAAAVCVTTNDTPRRAER